MVMELFVQLLNQTPLPAEQTLWARFSVCFSGLTVESAMIFKKKNNKKHANTKKAHNKKTRTHYPYNRHTQGFNKAS